MPTINATAKVHRNAIIADDVTIGPFTVVDQHVRIGPGTVIESHCIITGRTEIGAGNHIFSHAAIGTPPQDHTYDGEPTRLLIGDRNHIREFVSINTGTVKGGGITIIGSDNLLMACSHVAHDCLLGDRINIANSALLAGHVKVGDGCILSGATAIHHFVTLGELCMIGGLTGAGHDIPPYMIMLLDIRRPRAINKVGMERNGFTSDEISSVQRAFRLIYRSKLSREEVVTELENLGQMTRPVVRILEFMERASSGRMGRHLEITRLAPGDRP